MSRFSGPPRSALPKRIAAALLPLIDSPCQRATPDRRRLLLRASPRWYVKRPLDYPQCGPELVVVRDGGNTDKTDDGTEQPPNRTLGSRRHGSDLDARQPSATLRPARSEGIDVMPKASLTYSPNNSTVQARLLEVLSKWTPTLTTTPNCIDCSVASVQDFLELTDALCGLRTALNGELDFTLTGVGLDQDIQRTSADC